MPNAKISQLTAASTPLTGTELVPVVQGGVTKNVSAEDIVKSTIPSGTANGVLYLNASKQASSGSALTYNGSTLGINFPTSSNYRFYVSRGGTTGEVAAFTDGLAQTLTVDTTASSVLLNSANGGALVFGVSGEQMRLTSTGLGIGTSSPDNKLTISSGSINIFSLQNVADDYRFIGTQYDANNTNNSAQIRFAIDGTDTRTRIAFATSNGIGTLSEKMRLDASGNLGLGVTPSAWGSNSRALQVFTYSALYDFSSGYNGLAGNARHDGANWRYIASNRAISYEQSVAEGNHKWYTAPSGTADNTISFTQAMTLDASGNLLIGKTTVGTAGAGVYLSSSGVGITRTDSYPLTLRRDGSDGDIQLFLKSGTGVGSISVTTSATAYNTSSDYRLKNITGPITTSGAYIDSLNPVEGTWKADGSTFVGLIAHEVQEVSRTSIATGVKDGEEMQAMDYSSAELIANLIAEVKSLRARVAALEAA